MNNRSHLVATPITDANGKPTTVYRKVPVAGTPKAKLPAPRSATNVSPDAYVKSALTMLHQVGFLPSDDRNRISSGLIQNIELLAEHSPQTLSRLVRHISASDAATRSSWEWTLMSRGVVLSHDLSGANASRNVSERYRRRMTVQPTILSIQQNHATFSPESSTEAVMTAVDAYIEIHDTSSSHDEVRAAAIYFGIRNLSEEVDKVKEISRKDRDDMMYLANNIDAVETLLDELVARRTTDPEMIKQLLGTHSSLTEGNL